MLAAQHLSVLETARADMWEHLCVAALHMPEEWVAVANHMAKTGYMTTFFCLRDKDGQPCMRFTYLEEKNYYISWSHGNRIRKVTAMTTDFARSDLMYGPVPGTHEFSWRHRRESESRITQHEFASFISALNAALPPDAPPVPPPTNVARH